MRIYLQCWYFGRITINLTVNGVLPTMTINDLLITYFNQVIKANYCNANINELLPKMCLCGRNDFIYENHKTLGEYGIVDETAFTVICGFMY